ncbi:MAG: molybdopterin oxidoreductase [Bacteriovoracia bacterium]
MSHHTGHETNSVTAGSFKFSSNLKGLFGAFVLIGGVVFLLGINQNPDRAWPNFLLNYFFFMALGLFGGFFTALQHVTNSYWSVTVRRVAEALMSYLPFVLLLGVVLVLGRHHLYEWSHTEAVAHDELLHLKSAYLNVPFFLIRFFLFVSLWILLGFKMRKNSLNQDANGDHKFTLSNIKLACVFLPIFAISFSLISFDLLMSLEPHWFSTIYGIYCFAGLFYSGLSLLAFLVIVGRKQGVFSEQLVNENHIHDIGKLMFAFNVFWAYIMFSQLMLQWYANLPEETPYYILRLNSGWLGYSGVLLLVHFILPFFLLIRRGAKRNENWLKKMAILMLIAQWMDIYYLVMPVFFKAGPVFGWIEIGVFLGFLGLFGLSVGSFLSKVPAVPLKDPRMSQCLHHAQ